MRLFAPAIVAVCWAPSLALVSADPGIRRDGPVSDPCFVFALDAVEASNQERDTSIPNPEG
jgi:hypothetical protein